MMHFTVSANIDLLSVDDFEINLVIHDTNQNVSFMPS
jgi:hypothetical protein